MPGSSLCVRMKTGIWKSISMHKLNPWLSREAAELKLNAFQHHCAYFPSCIEQASKPVQTFTKRVFFLHLQSLRHSGVKQRFPAARECTCKEPLSVALASDCTNAASLTYESHKDSYIYTRTATPQREIVFSWYDDQMLGIEHTVMDVKACLIAKMHV